MTDIPANGNTLTYRVQRAEQDIRNLESQKAALRDLDALAKEVETLSEKVAANTRALVGFALTIAVAALGVAFAVLQSGS
jgi:hypothetical protein